MKIKSLLAAVSMVAITAGSANALVITNTTAGGSITPAAELKTPFDPGVALGTFNLEVAPNSNARFPGGTNLEVTVNLPTGVVFATDVQGSDITNAAESATVQNGTGLAGTSTVTFLADIVDVTTNEQPLEFNFDLALNDCPTGLLSVSVETEANTPIEQGTVELPSTNSLINSCLPAISAIVVSDEDDADTFITLASDYTGLGNDGPNSEIIGTLGTIQFDVDTNVSVDLTPTANPMDAADIESLAFDVVFPRAEGVDTVVINGTSGTDSGNGVFSFVITDASRIQALLDAPNRIIMTTNGTDAVFTQTPRVENLVATFDNDDLIDSVTFMNRSSATPVVGRLTGGDLDTLTREGRSFGYFDWNAGPGVTAPTFSVYRITGLPAGETIDYTVTLDNSNNDDTYEGRLTANAWGEAQLVSTTMPIPADTERFDVLINLETPELGIDVDRMLLRNGIVSSFGGSANWSYNNPAGTPARDTDDIFGIGQE